MSDKTTPSILVKKTSDKVIFSLLIVSWAISSGLSWLFASILSPKVHIEDIFDGGGAIGLAIGFAIGGICTGLLLQRKTSAIKKKHITLIAVGWGIGGLFGGIVGELLREYFTDVFGWYSQGVFRWSPQLVFFGAVSLALGGAIGGIATAITLQRTETDFKQKKMYSVALGWFSGWVAGGLISRFIAWEYFWGLARGHRENFIAKWGINRPINQMVFDILPLRVKTLLYFSSSYLEPFTWLIFGAICGIIAGAIGAGIMLRQLSKSPSTNDLQD